MGDTIKGFWNDSLYRQGIQDAAAMLEEKSNSSCNADLKLNELQSRKLSRILKRIEPLPEAEVVNVEKVVVPVKSPRNRFKTAVKKMISITSLRRK